jgi:hypothetical protein
MVLIDLISELRYLPPRLGRYDLTGWLRCFQKVHFPACLSPPLTSGPADADNSGMDARGGRLVIRALPVTAVFLLLTGMLGSTVIGTAHAQTAQTSASIDTSKPWARKTAFRASEGRIVLHYGEGIEEISARLEASSLTKSGYPAIAVPGGPTGMVELFVGKRIFGKYNQSQLDRGSLGSNAMELYDTFVKRLPHPDLVPLAR